MTILEDLMKTGRRITHKMWQIDHLTPEAFPSMDYVDLLSELSSESDLDEAVNMGQHTMVLSK